MQVFFSLIGIATGLIKDLNLQEKTKRRLKRARLKLEKKSTCTISICIEI